MSLVIFMQIKHWISNYRPCLCYHQLMWYFANYAYTCVVFVYVIPIYELYFSDHPHNFRVFVTCFTDLKVSQSGSQSARQAISYTATWFVIRISAPVNSPPIMKFETSFRHDFSWLLYFINMKGKADKPACQMILRVYNANTKITNSNKH